LRDEGWVLKKYTIAAIGLDAEEYDLTKVDENKFIYLEFFPNTLLDAEKERNKILEFVKQKADAVIFKERALKVEREKFYQQLKDETGAIPIIPIGTEVIEAGIYNIELTSVQEINRYFFYGGLKNITNALLYIAANVLGIDDLPSAEKPEPVAFEGIFHPDSETVFSSWDDYSNWYQGRSNYGSGQWVGLLTHRSNWVTNNLEVETALIRELEKLGIRVVPVFSYGTAEPELNTKDFDGIVDAYFSSDDHRLVIDALINLQVFILRSDTSGQNIFEQVVSKMKQLDIPVFKPIVSFGSKERWEESQQGLMLEIPWSFTVPEVQGMIEPLIIGYRDKEGKACFLPDRVIKFTRRVEKWLALRRTQNKDKRLAIFLHNAPCSGVEATIGMGAGLDVFTTVVNIINELKKSGWVVENIPAEGSELHQLIMERKAFADFRWTSVEEVVDSGGCLYQMPLDVYYPFYEQLDPQCQEDLEKTWGPPPGEGMVYQKHLIITGINFGNVSVLVQPKRGCYGAKCTGEVCKMLQDTHCPPPHQYLATYRYVEEVFKAHAVLHVGTHGNLEFLPGKSNALSRRCYPDLVLGALPNFYVYNAGVGTEGILAKRRTNAVIVDHLPPIYGVQNTGVLQLVNLIDNYLEAVNFKSDQVHALEALVREQLPQIPGAQTVVDRSETFFNGLIELKNSLVQSVCNPKCEKLHVFGSEKNEVAEQLAHARLHTQQYFQKWLERQTAYTIESLSKFKHYMLKIVGSNLSELGLEEERELLETHVDKVAERIQFIEELKRTASDIDKMVRNNIITNSTSVSELNAWLEQVKDFRKRLDNAKMRADIVQDDIDVAARKLADFNNACQNQLELYKERATAVFNINEINTSIDITNWQGEIASLLSVYDGQERDVEDLKLVQKQLDLIEMHYRQLDNEALSEEEFAAACMRCKEENDNEFADDAPPLDNELIYDSIKIGIFEKRKRIASEWMLHNVPKPEEILKYNATSAIQYKSRLQKMPLVLSHEQVKTVRERIKACSNQAFNSETDVELVIILFRTILSISEAVLLSSSINCIRSATLSTCVSNSSLSSSRPSSDKLLPTIFNI
jgi:cobalamin biosynthesis Mg chelatase CobN